VIKNKAIILTPLLFAWTIIFAHSIIPHNHHDIPQEECRSHSQHNDSSDNSLLRFASQFSDNNHRADNHDHCHFNINTTLTKFVDSPDAFLHFHNYINLPVLTQTQPLHGINNELLLKHIYFDSISHRGPPSFS